MTQKEKTKFRTTAKWKRFRVYIKKKYDNKDAITGKPLYKGWNLHHLQESKYDDLSEEKFLPLNKTTHKVVHWLERYENYEDIAKQLVITVKKMKEYKNE